MTGRAEIVVDGKNLLGEGVVWSPAHDQVQWVDISGKKFWTYQPSTHVSHAIELPERLACFAPLGQARILAGFASGLAYFDLATGAREPIAAIEGDRPTTRLNDGKLDRQGRLVFGTMDEAETGAGPIGQVWSHAAQSSPRVLFSGVRIANSIAFSPDGRRMYFADTPLRTIFCYDYDDERGLVHNRRVFAQVASGGGYPDGSAVDSDGCLWNAEWGGGRVVRYAPDGRVDRAIPLPCSQVTCCAFGGADLSTLFITTAAGGLDEKKRAAEPHAGALFAVHVGATGLADTPFREE
jgi:L-arabinonolactonase